MQLMCVKREYKGLCEPQFYSNRGSETKLLAQHIVVLHLWLLLCSYSDIGVVVIIYVIIIPFQLVEG